MLSQKPRLIPTSSTTPTDTTDMARGPLRLSLRPRLTPTTSMATATPPTAMATTERGLPMLSQKPRLIPTSSTTPTDTARGPLRLSLRPRLTPTTCTAVDIQRTDMSTESNQQEANFPRGPYKILAGHSDLC